MIQTYTKTTVACIQTNTCGDMQQNIAAAEALIRDAHGAEATFCALPENVFYMRGDFTYPASEHTYRMETHPGLKAMRALAKELSIWIHIGSLFVHIDNSDKWANRAVLVNDCGEVVTHYDKIHLFEAKLANGEEYSESKKFLAGKQSKLALTPFGQVGLTICYDVRFPRLYRDLALAGANSFLAPAAFANTTGQAHWHVLLRARAIENGAYVIAPAQCGEHPGGRKTYGHSLIINPWGEILAEASHDETGYILAEIDPKMVEENRHAMPTLKHDKGYFMEDFAI